mmetsp:Transcript_5729/g.7721  ORF Transcript_5729/g.7721 Transcript_5729/m.7721 type:complete len:85 (+) Transcript_5729:738-992(+)|eukprot:CAMPEP_0185576102 /NCGR_PEP_ID=MMETSP0434-20130131/7108_1 /TAXON_ID=626734 ORGANISM="Favella taraikaensis, Strain Fe Narragansett Bay" /NCGR_SAMPLE_ID=MMETSP0434 /ASSEMBLY_ACC=CAM_ASM_000379 /LENGTH=84 /DNA_ID=CAMNT_0028193183 /DNA_START=719 /DNA_END=973 /DNA_ORIENTATION=+
MLLSTATAAVSTPEEAKAATVVEQDPAKEASDAISEREAQIKELKEELSRFSDDYAALQGAKSALEAQLAEIDEHGSDSNSKIK